MHKIFTPVLLAALLQGKGSIAQVKAGWAQVFANINTEVLTHSKGYTTLRDATTSIGHRLTGSANGNKAESYVYQLLQSYGFHTLRYQPFEVESWSRGTLAVSLGGDTAHLQPIPAVTLAHSPVQASVAAPVVDMGNGLEEDYQAAPGKVKGKIALVYLGVLPGSKPGTPGLHRSEKTAMAIKYGAAGILLFNTVSNGVLLTGTASVTGKLIPIPAVCIGLEEGMRLKQQLQAGVQYAKLEMTNFSGMIKARNVIATVRGKSLPEEKIVVGGHLDSWDLATGAIDNGIGSFSVIDMARTFQALHLQPERTVEFVLFMGEEEGLLGSKAYVAEAIREKSLDRIRCMLNYDMTNDPKGYACSAAAAQELFRSIGAMVHAVDTSFSNLFRNGAGLHSDHQPFMLQGVPVGGAAGGTLPNNAGACYHADCDNFNLVEEKGMQNTIRFNAMLVYALADAPVLPVQRMSDEATKQFLLKNKLKDALQIAGEWRWTD